jgi:PAS domain S-box-containing protein
MSQLGADARIAALERKLAVSEAIRAAVMGAALDCVVTMDSTGRIVDFNKAAERTFGWPADEAIGRELAEVMVPPDLREVHRESLSRYVRTGDARILDQTLQLRAVRRNGQEFPVELKVTAISTDDGPLFAGYIRDMTERERAVRELAEAADRERDARRGTLRPPAG